MNRQPLRHRLATLVTLLAGLVTFPCLSANAQFAEFLRGSNLENARSGGAVKASMAIADDGSIAVLACVAKPETHSPSPYLILWKLRADGSLQWSRSWGFNQFNSTLTSPSTTLSIAFAPDGTLVIAGAFAGDIDFGGGPLHSAGYDIFFAKFDANGNRVWSRSFGAAGNDLGYQLRVDSVGNITLAGKHTGIDFGGGPLDAPANTIRFFRATFAPDGTHLNSDSFGSDEGTASINDMAISAAGDVYVIGGSAWKLKFGATTLDRFGSDDIVMVGFDPAGDVQMARRFGGEHFDTGYGIALTPEGDVLTAGVFSGNISVGGQVLGSCHAFSAAYVAGYGADGTHQWSRSSDPCAYGTFELTDFALHPSSGFVVEGNFKERVKFGDVSLFSQEWNSLTLSFDGDGNLIWMGKGSEGANGLAVAPRPDGNVVVAGSNNLDLYFCTGQIMKTPNARGFVAEFSDAPHIDTQAPPVPAHPECDGTTVSWDASIDPDGASVRYRVEEIVYFNAVERVTIVSGTSMPLIAGSPSDFIYLTAIDCFDHESAPSVRVEVHPEEWPPLRPQDVHFEGGALVWTNPPVADVVGVAVDGTDTWGGAADTVRLAVTMASTLNVENSSYRYYYVRGLDASGNWGEPALVVDQAPPLAPTGLAYTLPKLTWDASQDVGFGVFEIFASKFSDFYKDNSLGTTRLTEFEVPIEQRDSYYHIVQFDRSGNMSVPTTVAGQGGARPARPRLLAYRDGRLSWKATDDTDIDHYDVFVSTTDASEGPRAPLGTTREQEFLVKGGDHSWYYVIAIDEAGQESDAAVVSAITGLTPSFALSLGVLSNPFRNWTTLQYSLPIEGQVKLGLYDVRGAHVVTLVDGMKSGGSHYVDWSGGSENRGDVSAGVYFARLQFGKHERVVKLVLVR